MRAKKDKGPLRNFHFLKEADAILVARAKTERKDMVVVLEDLLLGRRQDGGEAWAVDEATALNKLSLDKKPPEAAKKAFWRFRRLYKIKTLPGGVYSARAIQRACE